MVSRSGFGRATECDLEQPAWTPRPAWLFLVEATERAQKEPGPRAYFGVRWG